MGTLRRCQRGIGVKMDKLGQQYEPGTVLFNEGEIVEQIWVINEGRIRLSRRINEREMMLETLGPGEFCGELALFSNGIQSSTATVIEAARLLVLDGSQFEAMIRSNGDIAFKVISKLALRHTELHVRLSTFQMRRTLGRLMLQLRADFDRNQEDGRATFPGDLPEYIGIDTSEFVDLVESLQEKELILLYEDEYFEIPNRKRFDDYLSYLEFKDRYEAFD